MKNININPNAIKALREFKNPTSIVFGKTLVPAMVHCSYQDGVWGDLSLIPYQMLQIDPAAKVLHYAQEIFEGLKAYKNEQGQVYLFRPEENAKRFNLSAHRIGMPSIDTDMFLQSVDLLSHYSSSSMGTHLEDSFYLRPFMFGDEAQLGVKPSSTYQYYCIGGPAGNYFSKSSVRLRVEREEHRAAMKGTGTAKTGGNYAASLASSIRSQELGFDQTLWLDPIEGRFIEELSGMNFFAVIHDVLVTPPLGNTILHGITRDSLLKLALKRGYTVQERPIDINELMNLIKSGECLEAFACGTASVLTPIGSIFDGTEELVLKYPEGLLSTLLKRDLLMIQTGRSEDSFGWRHAVSV